MDQVRSYALWKQHLSPIVPVQEAYLALEILQLGRNRWALLSWHAYEPAEVAQRAIELIQTHLESLPGQLVE